MARCREWAVDEVIPEPDCSSRAPRAAKLTPSTRCPDASKCVPDGVEGVGLACARPTDYHVHRSTTQAQLVDHGGLLGTDGRPGFHGGGDGGGIGGDIGSIGTAGQGDDPAFEGEDLRRCPPLTGQSNGVVGGQERIGPADDLVEGGTLAGGPGAGPDDVSSHEAGVLVGELCRQLVIVRSKLGCTGNAGYTGEVEAQIAGSLAPLGTQLGLGDPGGLGFAGGQSGQAGAVAGM